MYEWHKSAIERLKGRYGSDSRWLALILVGSVARGEARELSDIDLALVATDEAFGRCRTAKSLTFEADDLCDHPEGHAGGSVLDLSYLQDAAERADEPTRFQFVDARIIFSHLPELDSLLQRIALYPEHERLEKMKSFYSQLPLHLSFMELAEYSQNDYLLAETAVALVLYGGRLILAHNHMLYPNRKWFMRELGRAREKPNDFMTLATQLLREPSIKHAQSYYEAIVNFTDWPQPEEGAWQRLHQDSVWNWRSGTIPPILT